MMRRVCGWLLVVVYSYVQLSAFTDWSTVIVGLDKSVPRIEIMGEDGRTATCSGVVLNAEAGFVLSAAHCFEMKKPAVTVNGRHAEIARQNRLLDLAVLRADLKDAKALPLAKDSPKMGAEVAVFGYAFGAKKPGAQFGRVSLPLDDDGALVLDLVVIGGDSGGPAINAQGELVGMTSAVKFLHPSMHAALLVPLKAVRDFVEHYLPAKP